MSTITLTMLAETKGINKGIKDVNSKLDAFGKTAGKVSGVMKAALAGAAASAVVNFGKSVVSAASDAQQSLGASQVIFGKFSDTVIQKSNAAANAYGLSANQYRESANLIGSLFKNQGVALDQLAGKTDNMVKLGSDLSATFGGTTKDAVEALSSAFKGEFDPLERYGISIKQSSVSTEAAALAQSKYGKSLKSLSVAQQRQLQQQATSNLLMKQTKDAQGQFGKQTNTLAEQQQILGAQWANLKVTLGNVLLPVVTKVFQFLNANFAPALTKVGTYVDKAKAALKGLADQLKPVGDWFKSNPEVIKGAAIGLGIAAAAAAAFAVAMGAVAVVTSPITAVVVAVAALGAAVAYAYKHSQSFRNGVAAVGAALKQFGTEALAVGQQVVQVLIAKWQQFQPAIQSIWNNVKSIVSSALSIIGSVIKIAVGVIQAVWQRFGGTIVRFLSHSLSNAVQVLKGAFNIIAGIFKVVSNVLKGNWRGAWNGVKQIVKGAVQVVIGVVKQFGNIVRTVLSLAWSAMKAAASAAWNGLKAVVSGAIHGVISIVKGIPGKVKYALGDLGGLLKDAGKKVIQGFIDGIGDMFGSVQNKLGELTNKLTSWKGPPKKDRKILRPNGILVMKGFIAGLQDGTAGVKATLGKVTDNLEKYLAQHYTKLTAKQRKARLAVIKKSLKDEIKALTANAKQRDAIYKKLTAAQSALADLKKSAADYAANVKSAAVDFASITNLNGPFNSDGIVAGLQARLDKLKQFADLIKSLKAKGLNSTSIDQLVQAGVEGGLATAQALADGGKDAISQVNDIQAQISTAADGLGTTAAGSMYNAGIQAAQGLVNGLKSKAKDLETVAIKLAHTLANAIRHALGIHSPSRVFKKVGQYTVAGLAQGLNDTSAVTKAMRNVSSAVTNGYAVAPAANAPVGGGTVIYMTNEIKADATTDGRKLGRELVDTINLYLGETGKRLATA